MFRVVKKNRDFFNYKLFVQFISASFCYEQTLHNSCMHLSNVLKKYIPIPEEKEIVVI